MSDPTGTDGTTAARAAELRDEMLGRSQGMPESVSVELFSQQRTLSKTRADISPALVVDSAEGTTIFRGLNHSRNLLGPIDVALEKIAEDPQRAISAYENQLREARGDQPASDAPTAR